MKFHKIVLFAGLALTVAGIIMFLYGIYMISNPALATVTATATEYRFANFSFSYFLPVFFFGIFVTLVGSILNATQSMRK